MGFGCDLGEILVRFGWDLGEIWVRCGWDLGEILGEVLGENCVGFM